MACMDFMVAQRLLLGEYTYLSDDHTCTNSWLRMSLTHEKPDFKDVTDACMKSKQMSIKRTYRSQRGTFSFTLSHQSNLCVWVQIYYLLTSSTVKRLSFHFQATGERPLNASVKSVPFETLEVRTKQRVILLSFQSNSGNITTF